MKAARNHDRDRCDGVHTTPIARSARTASAGSGTTITLRRVARVAMMQPADHRDRPDRAKLGRFDLTRLGGVAIEREMTTRGVIVFEVA